MRFWQHSVPVVEGLNAQASSLMLAGGHCQFLEANHSSLPQGFLHRPSDSIAACFLEAGKGEREKEMVSGGMLDAIFVLVEIEMTVIV